MVQRGCTRSPPPTAYTYDENEFEQFCKKIDLNFETPIGGKALALAHMTQPSTDEYLNNNERFPLEEKGGIRSRQRIHGVPQGLIAAHLAGILASIVLKKESTKEEVTEDGIKKEVTVKGAKEKVIDDNIDTLPPEAQHFLRGKNKDDYKNYIKLLEIITLYYNSGRVDDSASYNQQGSTSNILMAVKYFLSTTTLSQNGQKVIYDLVERGLNNKGPILFTHIPNTAVKLHTIRAFEGHDKIYHDIFGALSQKEYELRDDVDRLYDEVKEMIQPPTSTGKGRKVVNQTFIKEEIGDPYGGICILEENFATLISEDFKEAAKKSLTSPLLWEYMKKEHPELEKIPDNEQIQNAEDEEEKRRTAIKGEEEKGTKTWKEAVQEQRNAAAPASGIS